MDRYYVNKNAQPTGEHEVHREGCSFMPDPENKKYLGDYETCYLAVREARKFYGNNVDGCAYCCPGCHTR